jgi:hypothetical protein
MCSYLVKCGSKYYFRRGIPAHVHTMMGRKETSTSLRTTDKEEAKRRIPQYVIAFDKEMDGALGTFTQMWKAPNDAEAGAIFAQWRRREQVQFQHEQAGAAHFENEDEALAERQAARADLRRHWETRFELTTAELTPSEAALSHKSILPSISPR